MLCLSWQIVAGLVASLYGAIGTAMWGYFSLHNDLRNRDGTVPTTREHWIRILGLLAYFSIGWIAIGGVFYVVLRVVSAF